MLLYIHLVIHRFELWAAWHRSSNKLSNNNNLHFCDGRFELRTRAKASSVRTKVSERERERDGVTEISNKILRAFQWLLFGIWLYEDCMTRREVSFSSRLAACLKSKQKNDLFERNQNNEQHKRNCLLFPIC